jgi:hypothetical protein
VSTAVPEREKFAQIARKTSVFVDFVRKHGEKISLEFFLRFAYSRGNFACFAIAVIGAFKPI